MHHMIIDGRLLSRKVEKGRSIYAGIQKFVAFIMSVHIAEARDLESSFIEPSLKAPNASEKMISSYSHRELLLSGCGRSCRFSSALLWVSRSLGLDGGEDDG